MFLLDDHKFQTLTGRNVYFAKSATTEKAKNVSTFRFCQTSEHIVHQKNDEKLKLHLGDFSKLIANEAVYHKGCHASYINVKDVPLAERDIAFKQFLEQIEQNVHFTCHPQKQII